MSAIPIFIINLKKDTEKKQHMEALCRQHNFQCQFTEAVYGKDLDEKSLSRVYNKEASIRVLGRELSKSEIGCALSHINIYKHMIDQNIEKAIIFEDDIRIEEGFSSVMNNISQFPNDWELVLLGYHSDSSMEKCTKASLRYRKKITSSHYTVRLIENAYGTYGYLINLQGAKKLIKQLSIIRKPIDLYIGSDERINLYAISPRIIRIHDTLSKQSNIAEERQQMADNSNLYKKKGVLYKIKRELLRPLKQLIKHFYDPIKTLKVYS